MSRAEYIGRGAASSPATTLAFPLGPPTRLLASFRNTSVRPLETLTPVGKRLNLPVDNGVEMADVAGFVKYLQHIRSRDTLLVAWQHWFIPHLAAAIDPRKLAPRHFPTTCNPSQWEEPEYTHGACYDIIWQFMLYRENSEASWRAEAFSQM